MNGACGPVSKLVCQKEWSSPPPEENESAPSESIYAFVPPETAFVSGSVPGDRGEDQGRDLHTNSNSRVDTTGIVHEATRQIPETEVLLEFSPCHQPERTNRRWPFTTSLDGDEVHTSSMNPPPVIHIQLPVQTTTPSRRCRANPDLDADAGRSTTNTTRVSVQIPPWTTNPNCSTGSPILFICSDLCSSPSSSLPLPSPIFSFNSNPCFSSGSASPKERSSRCPSLRLISRFYIYRETELVASEATYLDLISTTTTTATATTSTTTSTSSSTSIQTESVSTSTPMPSESGSGEDRDGDTANDSQAGSSTGTNHVWSTKFVPSYWKFIYRNVLEGCSDPTSDPSSRSEPYMYTSRYTVVQEILDNGVSDNGSLQGQVVRHRLVYRFRGTGLNLKDSKDSKAAPHPSPVGLELELSPLPSSTVEVTGPEVCEANDMIDLAFLSSSSTSLSSPAASTEVSEPVDHLEFDNVSELMYPTLAELAAYGFSSDSEDDALLGNGAAVCTVIGDTPNHDCHWDQPQVAPVGALNSTLLPVSAIYDPNPNSTCPSMAQELPVGLADFPSAISTLVSCSDDMDTAPQAPSPSVDVMHMASQTKVPVVDETDDSEEFHYFWETENPSAQFHSPGYGMQFQNIEDIDTGSSMLGIGGMGEMADALMHTQHAQWDLPVDTSASMSTEYSLLKHSGSFDPYAFATTSLTGPELAGLVDDVDDSLAPSANGEFIEVPDAFRADSQVCTNEASNEGMIIPAPYDNSDFGFLKFTHASGNTTLTSPVLHPPQHKCCHCGRDA
ncbi:hypothetical protein D9758_007595 [Tetrapyrgos nigripes]|uniref:Uncharacterized protein n=1 Tax=Tetrapyrgos nigripes TaxID=182062 RepID=A0A8H5LK65_9AGAR|nr:hypothetical protein D9758_007595 [Tetrapyrgos nigripes]